MALVRWKPYRDLFSIQDEINRMFEDFSGGNARETEDRLMRIIPAADIVEDKDRFFVKVELPGIRKEDVRVAVHNNMLTISGEKKREFEDKGDTAHRVERSYGVFSRTFELPGVVDHSGIKADYKDGILTLEIPKSEESKPKEIAINVK
jgi:HSP20 family protein